MSQLKLKPLWLLIGYGLVAFVIYSSLTSSPMSVGVKVSDKIMHIVGYFVLMGWFIQIYHQRRVHILLAAGFITMGIGLEFLQDLGGVRMFELYDMLANTTGVVLAWFLIYTPLRNTLSFFEKRFLGLG